MKKWYCSRTIWANALMLAGALIANISGQDILTPEVQASILAVVNVILRVVTKEEITW